MAAPRALITIMVRAAASRFGGLTVRALAAAVEINAADKPMTQADLRVRLGMTHMQASRAIGTCVDMKIVRRTAGNETGSDRRLIHLHSTPDGRHLVSMLGREITP
jgi:DNA-binding MarR family transcriptional regulator